MKSAWLILITFCLSFSCFSQNEIEKLNIGDYIPSTVWKKIPLKRDVQLVILDFWSTGCATCMESFPHMENLQKEFSAKLQVVLINPWENSSQANERMDKINVNRSKNGMQPFRPSALLPAVFGDPVFSQMFPALSVPQHVWTDSHGKVLYITYGYNANEINIKAVIDGKKINMALKDDLAGQQLLEKGYIQPTLQNTPPVYYSAFIPYYSTVANSSNRVDSIKGIFRMVQYNSDPIFLFKIAFNKSDSKNRVLLEVKDKEQYQIPNYWKEGYLIDDWNRKFAFSYELQMPLKDRNKWQEKMQEDVNYFFGNRFGIEGGMEKRKFKSLVLIKTKNGLLKSINAETSYKNRDTILSVINYPFIDVVSALSTKLEDMNAKRPFINETGIDPNLKVDMQLTGDLKNVENVRKQLQQYGLDIIEAERELEVLVIRDKPQIAGNR